VRNAIAYSIAAADAAEAVFAYEDALSHLRPALAIAGTHDRDAAQRAAVLLRLGRITAYFENHEQGVAYLKCALKIFEQIGDNQHAGEIRSHFGRLFSAFGPHMNVGRALTHLQRAEILLERNSESYPLGTLYWALSMTYCEALRIEEAITASQKGMDIFARLGDRESWASVAGNLTRSRMVQGKLAEAVDLCNEMAREGAAFDDPDAFSHMAWSCGWFRFAMRDPIGAMRWFRIGLNKPGHDLKLRAQLLVFLNQSEVVAGNLAKAKQQAGEIVNPTFRMLSAYFQGDWEATGDVLEKSLDRARRTGSKFQEVNTLSCGVDLQRVIGDYSGAIAALERALPLYQPDDLYWDAHVRTKGVLLYFDAGQLEKIAEHAEHCRRIVTDQEDWLGRAGPLWRAAAIGAAVEDRFEESERYFEKSKEICRWYSLPWDEAETLHYWGKALLHAGRPDRAREKLDAAITIYRDYGAGQSWIDRVEADRRSAQPPSANSAPWIKRALAAKPSLPSASAHVSGAVDLEATFRNRGDSWTISFAGKTSQMRDAKGLHYLAYLLRAPWTEFAAVELANTRAPNIGNSATVSLSDIAENGIEIRPDLDGATPALDLRARAEYRQRLTDLKEELEVAERHNDPGRKERLLSEIDALMEELKTRFGRGKELKAASHRERARSTVSKRIRFALDQLRQVNSELAKHLTDSIRTGYNCVYRPKQKINWIL